MVSGGAAGCGSGFRGPTIGRLRSRLALRRRIGGCLGRRLLGPFLVEVDAPLALVVLLELELRAEGAAGAALETGHGLERAARPWLLAALARLLQRLHQFLHDRRRQVLAGLLLPGHEAAPWVV